MRRASIVLGCALLILGVGLALVGCAKTPKNGIATARNGSHPTATPSPSSSLTAQEAALKFAQCMRDHGIQMEDPDTSGGGVRIQIQAGAAGAKGAGGGQADAKTQAALNACKQYLPNGGAPPSMSPQDLAKLRQYAKCMRDHGIDMQDPTAANPGISVKNVNPNDPKFKAATEACKSLLPSKMQMKSGGGR